MGGDTRGLRPYVTGPLPTYAQFLLLLRLMLVTDSLGQHCRLEEIVDRRGRRRVAEIIPLGEAAPLRASVRRRTIDALIAKDLLRAIDDRPDGLLRYEGTAKAWDCVRPKDEDGG